MPLQAYQIFFTVGAINALMGVVLWLFYSLRWLPYSPMFLHSHLMVGGFILAYTMGFLMTSVPRMTSSANPRKWEINLAILLLLAFWPIGFWFDNLLDAHLAVLITFVLYFVVSRRWTGRSIPHEYFKFIILSLCVGDVGLLLGNKWMWSFLFPLLLIVGVGSRLITGLLGYQTTSPCASVAARPNLHKKLSFHFLRNGGALKAWFKLKSSQQFCWMILASVMMLSSEAIQLAQIVLAIIFTWIAVEQWKIHQGPASKSLLAKVLWVSIVCMFVGLWLNVGWDLLGSPLKMAGMHLIFVGGFALVTLLVATRVSLAHGGYNLVFEYQSSFFIWWATLLLVSMALRFLGMIEIAALFWVASVAAWMSVILPRTWKWKKILPIGTGIAVK